MKKVTEFLHCIPHNRFGPCKLRRNIPVMGPRRKSDARLSRDGHWRLFQKPQTCRNALAAGRILQGAKLRARLFVRVSKRTSGQQLLQQYHQYAMPRSRQCYRESAGKTFPFPRETSVHRPLTRPCQSAPYLVRQFERGNDPGLTSRETQSRLVPHRCGPSVEARSFIVRVMWSTQEWLGCPPRTGRVVSRIQPSW